MTGNGHPDLDSAEPTESVASLLPEFLDQFGLLGPQLADIHTPGEPAGCLALLVGAQDGGVDGSVLRRRLNPAGGHFLQAGQGGLGFAKAEFNQGQG